MLVMRGVQHIHLGQYVWEGVEHIQYPRLCLAAMELQPLERIRPQVHHVLPPRGFDQHACARMNDNRDEINTRRHDFTHFVMRYTQCDMKDNRFGMTLGYFNMKSWYSDMKSLYSDMKFVLFVLQSYFVFG